MKKIVTIMIAAFMGCLTVSPQSVFPESDAIWNIQINNREYFYGLSGDTVLNGIDYHKLYLLNDTTLNIDSEDTYIGGFRNDGKKVWFLANCYPSYWGKPIDDEEILLYDFSKNVGDTIWHNGILDYTSVLKPCFSNDDRIVSIVSNIIEENGVKKYELHLGRVDDHEVAFFINSLYYCVEHLGSLSGLFWFLKEDPMSGGSYRDLACFKRGTEVKYMNNPLCSNCFCWSDTRLSTNNYSNIEVVWLPKQNSIEIKGESLPLPVKLRLFDSKGGLLIEKNMQSAKEKLPLNNCFRDAFLFQLEKNNRIVKTGKLTLNNE